MWRLIALSGSILIAALQAPVLFDKVLKARENSAAAPVENSQRRQTKQSDFATKPKVKKVSYSGRKVRIRAGYGGHFVTDVRMNNRSVKVLVDTGATMVAISESTARKIGIFLKPSDFKYKVNTANGVAKMASVTIREISIGNIRVKNVRAGVAKEGALTTTLLGMSFLNKLRRFEVRGDTLLLEH